MRIYSTIKTNVETSPNSKRNIKNGNIKIPKIKAIKTEHKELYKCIKENKTKIKHYFCPINQVHEIFTHVLLKSSDWLAK